MQVLNSAMNLVSRLPYFSQKAERVVGVKIGHSNIAAVEVEKASGSWTIRKVALESIVEGQEQVVGQLKRFFDKEGLCVDKINTSISGADVIVRFLQYPFMPKKDLRNSLEYEAEKYIPFNISDVTLDFSILSERKDPGRRFYSLALVAAKRDTVMKLHDVFHQAGLELNAMDVDPFASVNVFQHGYAENADKTVALINIGSQVTNITILHEGKPVFTRDLVFGGEDITKKIAKRMNISLEEALILKHDLEAGNSEINVVLRESLRYLLEEIQLSFQFFTSQVVKGEIPKRVFLLGGSSGLKGLPEILKEAADVEVEIMDPLKHFVLSEEALLKKAQVFRGSLAVPLGLALRG